MIAILDYGAGNLTSVRLAFRRLGAEAQVVQEAAAMPSGVTHVVFPGVGSARSGMEGVRARGFDGVLKGAVAEGKPVLAICLGEQLVFDSSDEDGGVEGLGLVPGRVIRFDFPPEAHVEHIALDGDDIEKAARLADLLEERKFLR